MKPADPELAALGRAHAPSRRALVRHLSENLHVKDARLLEAFGTVPRHLFVPPHLASEAYVDRALPIGEGQTISQPSVVARSLELCRLRPDARVLEIGTGSGYQTALLSALCRAVFSLERISALAVAARALLARLGVGNVSIKVFDGTYGWADPGPYDAIVVSAAAPDVPDPLLKQLAPGGRLVLPVGDKTRQRLLSVSKLSSGRFRTVEEGEVSFVPLIGRYGFEAETAPEKKVGRERPR